MAFSDWVLDYASSLSPKDFALAVIAIFFTLLINFKKVRALQRQIEVLEAAKRALEVETEGKLSEQEIKGWEAKAAVARGHLAARSEVSIEYTNELRALDERKQNLPAMIRQTKADAANLQRRASAMEKELEGADREISDLKTEKNELNERIESTKGFIKLAESKIQQAGSKLANRTGRSENRR